MYGCLDYYILEFQVSVTNCSLAERKINRCRVCLFHSQSYMAVYGYSTYSSYTTQWTWKYSQLYSITLNEQTLTLQLYIRYSHCIFCFKNIMICVYAWSDSVEEICWVGNEALKLYNVLCNVPGVWDCTKQAPEAVTPDSSSTLVKLEESDYTSLGVFLPDDLIQKMEGSWFYQTTLQLFTATYVCRLVFSRVGLLSTSTSAVGTIWSTTQFDTPSH